MTSLPLMWSTVTVDSSCDMGWALPAVVVDGSDDLYEGYNDFDPKILVYGEGQAEGTTDIQEMKIEQPLEGRTPETHRIYGHAHKYSQDSSTSENQNLRSSNVQIIQGGKLDLPTLRTPTIRTPVLTTQGPQMTSKWRPPSTGRTTRAQSLTSAPQNEVVRPLTAIRAAGYSSRGSKFDPLNQGAPSSTPARSKEESNPEYQSHLIERQVNQLLEESATAGFVGDRQTALEKARDAERKERLLCKQREQAGMMDHINIELTMAVSFNLGYQYQATCLEAEALSTYSRIIRNKQFTQSGRLRINMGNIYYGQKKYVQAVKMYRMALDQTANNIKETRYRIMRNIGIALMQLGRYQDAAQSFEAVVEIKVDHQSCYNLIVCYFILGHAEKMKIIFTKMLLVKHYDAETEEDVDGDHSAAFWNDPLRDELRTRQTEAYKCILIAARLIAPVFGDTCMEGFDRLIDMLKDQQYIALASEMEMCKAMQYLRWQDFGQAVTLLKNFERKEKDLKARAATNLSFLYFLEGDSGNAEKYSELAVKTNRYNSCALVNHGNCLYARGDTEGAISLYKEAVEIESDCVEAIYNIGLSYKRVNAPAEALRTFEKLSNLLPNNVEVSFQIAHVNELMGNYHQTIKWLEIVNTRVMQDAGVLAWLGSMHSRLQDESKALHYYGESHRVYPGCMDITSWLGAYYIRTEVYEKALPYFELAFKFQPAEVKWQLLVASCYRRTGQYKLAMAKYKSILEKHQDNVECLRYLVHMCTSLGKKDDLLHYESRLRAVESGRQRNASGEKMERGRGSSYSMRQDEGVSKTFAASKDLGRGDILDTEFVPEEAVFDSPRKPAQKFLTQSKKRCDDEWAELGDDLLPL